MQPTPRQIVDQTAEALGFAMVGVTRAMAINHRDFFTRWLAQGRHGEMAYLARDTAKRTDPAKLVPGASSVICVADVYPGKGDRHLCSPQTSKKGASPQGRIARYAWGSDYHKVIKKRLYQLADGLRCYWPDEQYKSCVDTAPIMERDHAARTELGWIGKHTLLIHPRLGSWLLLGQIVTTLVIEADEQTVTDHCGTCTRCIDACPTDCLAPYKIDASRCISYLTIEHRGSIDPSLHPSMGDWLAGCDVCQEVCPFNAPQRLNVHCQAPNSDSPAPTLALLDILNWDAQARQKVLQGSALKRIKLDMFKRNALIAAGNYLARHSDPALRRKIELMAGDPDEVPMVRHTAGVVIERVRSAGC